MKKSILFMKRAAAGLVVAVSASPAFAALDADLVAQTTEGLTDVQKLGAIFLGLVIAAAIYKHMRRAA